MTEKHSTQEIQKLEKELDLRAKKLFKKARILIEEYGSIKD